MTDVMAQQGLGLNTPTSRQDVVSALLNDYYASSSPLSPAFKELPSPPPGSESTTLAVQRMNKKFQLRDLEEAPVSPQSPQSGASTPRSKKRIVSRSLSRDSKPPSLKLVISNGTTATIPVTPALPVPTRTLPSSQPPADKELPPPPPAKSERRNTQLGPMGNQHSRSAKELARNDSLLSQSEAKVTSNRTSGTIDASPVVRRKAVPEPTLTRFKSLAELGQGPRGGKGGPMPPTSAPRKASVDSATTDVGTSKTSTDSWTSTNTAPKSSDVTVTPRDIQKVEQPSTRNVLPPTPDQDENNAAPAPPRKVFAAVGLPSNPRGRSPPSPRHMRGKSSTGFNLLKAHRPAPPIPMAHSETITPEMTPSPTLKPDQRRKDAEISPVSPLPPRIDQNRPFSYEKPRPESQVLPTAAAPPAPEPAPIQAKLPSRATTLDPPEPSPSIRPSTAPSQRLPEASRSPPPFTSLTRQHIPLPISLIPEITPTQLNCYTAHRTTVWSNNAFQPLGCMVCHTNERDRKWACTWCQLRICKACTDELCMVPGRDLGRLLRAKEEAREVQDELEGKMKPGIMVSGVEDGGGDDYENTFRA